jgi:DsbC/DsbD-like thiol-disulfide interchange protein
MERREQNRPPMKVYATLVLVLLAGIAMTQDQRGSNSVVQYTIQQPDEVNLGSKFQIGIIFTVQPGWYIYAPTGVNAAQGMIETNVIFSLPRGIVREGKVKLPDPHFKNGHEVYEGDSIMVSQVLKIGPGFKPGPYEIQGKITWQTCNSDICLPPTTDEIRILIQVRK